MKYRLSAQSAGPAWNTAVADVSAAGLVAGIAVDGEGRGSLGGRISSSQLGDGFPQLSNTGLLVAIPRPDKGVVLE